jgi:hypothetical protein
MLLGIKNTFCQWAKKVFLSVQREEICWIELEDQRGEYIDPVTLFHWDTIKIWSNNL